MNFKDNLFNANHRNAMIQAHGFTEAQTTTVEDLMQDYTLEEAYRLHDLQEVHDCTLSEMDSCKGCEMVFEALEDLSKGKTDSDMENVAQK